MPATVIIGLTLPWLHTHQEPTWFDPGTEDPQKTHTDAHPSLVLRHSVHDPGGTYDEYTCGNCARYVSWLTSRLVLDYIWTYGSNIDLLININCSVIVNKSFLLNNIFYITYLGGGSWSVCTIFDALFVIHFLVYCKNVHLKNVRWLSQCVPKSFDHPYEKWNESWCVQCV